MTAVAVVIPAYDAEQWLGETLASLQQQTLRCWHAVVVDDGSRDGTLALARAIAADDERIEVLTQPNAGVAAARAAGLDAVREATAYVAFLDADDRYAPTALERLLARLEQRPDAVGAYCLARYVDKAGEPVLAGRHEAVMTDRRTVVGRRVVGGSGVGDLTFDSLAVTSPVWPAAVALLRTDVVRAVGGPDPTFRVQEDWELYLRMSRRGPFAVEPATLVDYRRHGSNATAVSTQHVFQMDRLWHKAFGAADNTRPQRRTVRRAWRWLELRQAREHLRQLPTALRRRDRPACARAATGAVLCLAVAALPSPPRPRLRLSLWMHRSAHGRESWQV